MAVHAGPSLKKDWPLLAIGGVALAVFAYSRTASSSSGSAGPRAIYPRAIGGQRGSSGRSSATSNDAGQLATQVIGDVIGQKVALTQAADQLKLGEDQLTTEQNIAYRESNVQVQQQQNQLSYQTGQNANWWTQLIPGLLNGASMAFGGPPIFGGFGGGSSYGGYGGYGGGNYGMQAPWWMSWIPPWMSSWFGGYGGPYGAPPWYGGGYGYPATAYPQTSGGGSGMLW